MTEAGMPAIIERCKELEAQGDENLREMNLLQVQRALMWHRFHDFWDAQSKEFQTSDAGMELRQKYEGEDFEKERAINTKIQRKKLIEDELDAIVRLVRGFVAVISKE